jgi:hypothetical protein
VCNGNTHGAITSGQYVYVRAHDTLQEGLYTANSNIAANATLSSSNLTANSSGGLNSLNEQIGNVNTDVALKVGQTNPFKMVDADNGTPNINQMFSFTDSNTLNTPYKQGITNVTNQLIITLYGNNTYNTQIAVNIGGTDMYIRRRNTGGWSSWYQFAMSS